MIDAWFHQLFGGKALGALAGKDPVSGRSCPYLSPLLRGAAQFFATYSCCHVAA